jgi:hypothetical protein
MGHLSNVNTETLPAFDQAEEEILTHMVSDELLEAAAGMAMGAELTVAGTNLTCGSPC